mgnify:FL=1|jgi:hypothetical protein|tara:strand:+ start:1208 stop:1435 length:228 start_codon:yes stop_codon:yes gene_type:complete
MKINGSFSIGNVWTIAITILALAVLWGSSQNKIDNLEKAIETKANKELVEVKFEFIQTQLSDIKDLLEPIFVKTK